MWDYFWHVWSLRHHSETGMNSAGGVGDVRLKLCCSLETIFKVLSSRKHLASFSICIYMGKGLLSPRCYMWLPPCLVTEYVLSTGWNAACWWLNYSKPPTCPKAETDHSSRAGHFIKSMLSLFMSDSKRHKWLTCDAVISSISGSANEHDIHWCVV